MLDVDVLELRDQFVLTRDLVVAGDRSVFFARVRRGDFVAVHRGVYIAAESWAGMDSAARSRARTHAVMTSLDRDLVASHHSAAMLWRLPWVGPLPTATHIVDDTAAGGRSTKRIVRHSIGSPDERDRIDGISVTTLARTVIDLCRISTFAQAVTITDAALHRNENPPEGLPHKILTKSDLLAELSVAPLRRGTARARRAVDFANGAADRPGESLSRVNMSLANLTAPELQVEIRGASGRRYFVDFWWKRFNMIGEFDGDAKYENPEFLRGRTPKQALIDEKRREDDLRAAHHGMTRWPWEVALSMPKLRRHLLQAGVR